MNTCIDSNLHIIQQVGKMCKSKRIKESLF